MGNNLNEGTSKMREFIYETKRFGWGTAWYNLRWNFAYWLLGASSMKVTRKKK